MAMAPTSPRKLSPHFLNVPHPSLYLRGMLEEVLEPEKRMINLSR